MIGLGRLWSAIVLGLAMAVAGLAPAQAQDGGKAILVLDASGSMWGQIDGKSKWEIAEESVADLVNGWNKDIALGLTVYGHRTKGACDDIEDVIPVGPVDAAQFKQVIDKLSPKGKTPMTAAVRRAAEALKFTEEQATVILVSDGNETCGLDPCAIASELERLGVDFTAHVIGFDIRDKATIDQLKCIADNTGGTFVQADDAASLGAALTTVAAATAAPAPPPPPAPEPAPVPSGKPTFTAVYAEGQTVEEKSLSWHLYPDVPGADPATAEVGRHIDSAYRASWTPGKALTPGDYLIRAELGAVKVTRRVTLTGEKQDIVIDLQAAVITTHVVDVEGGSAPGGQIVWRLFAGSRQAQSANKAEASFVVPAGEWRLTVTKDFAVGETALTVKPGDRPDVTIVLDAGTLKAEMRPSEDQPPATKDVTWKIYPEGSDRAVATVYKPAPEVMLSAGTYRVTARQGDTTGEATVEIKPGEVTALSLVLGAGVLQPTAIFAEGAPPPTKDLRWQVFDAATDLSGKRGRALVTSYETKPTLMLPAGRYYIEVRTGSANVGAEVEVPAGGTASPTLNLDAGAILGGATKGGAKLTEKLTWNVYQLIDSMTGQERKRIETSYSGEPTWILPAGTYVVTVRAGDKTVESEVTVVAGKPTRVSLSFD